jgi:hypothetical protein
MASQAASPFRVGRLIEIKFQSFTSRITFRSERELTVEIVAGDNAGFSDTVSYEAVPIRDDIVILSWQEHIGSTVVHVLDFTFEKAYSAITPAKGGFLRLRGQIESNPQ